MSQRDVMRAIWARCFPDEVRAIREYAAAERRGEAVRTSNTDSTSPEAYARALLNDGLKKGWLRVGVRRKPMPPRASRQRRPADPSRRSPATSIPPGPAQWPPEIRQSIRDAAEAWFGSPVRPTVAPDVLEGWDRLVERWIRNRSMPLLIRRSGERGKRQHHASGRPVVAVDNSPAHWALATALRGIVPTLEQVRSALEDGSLPVVYVASKKKLAQATYSGALGRTEAKWLNSDGWKVCHINPVGLRLRGDLTSLPIDDLEAVARRLVRPRNMFLVPTEQGGFGELPEVIEVARRHAGLPD